MRNVCRVASVALALLVPRNAVAEHPRAVYVEAFGKGGVWGLGFDQRVTRRISFGVVGSGLSLEGQRYVSFSPYMGVYLARHGRSAWFADVGGQVAHVWTRSPVPEWSGPSSTGVGALGSTGYEFRGRVVVRVYVHGVVGKGGAFPWAGTGIGWSF